MQYNNLIGQQFGEFWIEAFIDETNYGALFRASAGAQYWALKLLPLGDSEQRARYVQDVEYISALQHPFLVPVREVGVREEFLYIATPFYDNGTLRERFARGANINLKRALAYVQQISAALDVLHTNAIVHHQLRFSNVVLDEKKNALVADAYSHLWVGTANVAPFYIAPEQALGSPNQDHRSDVYALGVMAYVLLTGYFPFWSRQRDDLLSMHIGQQPLPPSRVNKNLPNGLDKTILRALAKDPADRYHRAGDFAASLVRSVGKTEDTVAIRLAPDFQAKLKRPTVDYVPSAEPNSIYTEEVGRSIPWVGILGSLLGIILIAVVVIILLGVPESSPAEEFPTATVTLTSTDLPTLTPLPTATPTLTRTPTPTATPATPTATVTLTLAPSLTPLTGEPPTPIPTVPQQINAVIQDGRSGSRLRDIPGLSGNILVFLDESTPLEVIGRTTDEEWLQVRTSDGVDGWIQTRLVDLNIPVSNVPVTGESVP